MPANPMTNPDEATLAHLVEMCREMGAGTMKLSGRDGKDRPVFLVLIAVDEEARRLEPEIERLTEDEAKEATAGERVFLCVKCGAAWGDPFCSSCKAEAVEVIEDEDGLSTCTRCGYEWPSANGSHRCAQAPAAAPSSREGGDEG